MDLDVVSVGYTGSISEAEAGDWLRGAPGINPSFIGNCLRPSLGAGARIVQFEPGLCGGHGVSDLIRTAPQMNIPALASNGVRYDTVVLRRDKTAPAYSAGPPEVRGGKTTLELILGNVGGSRTPNVPASNPSTISYSPVAMFATSGTTGASTTSEFVDLRLRRSENLLAADPMALSGTWDPGSVVTLDGGGVYVRNDTEWVSLDQSHKRGTQPPTWNLPVGTPSVSGAITPVNALAMHPAVTVPVPNGVRALVKTQAWALCDVNNTAIIRLTPRGVWSEFNGVHDFNGQSGSSATTYGPLWMLKAWEERIVTGPVTYQPTVQITGAGAKARIYTAGGLCYSGSSWEWEMV